MVKFLKSGKVVIVLNGRYAGKKAVIVKSVDSKNDADTGRTYGYAIVAGVERSPLKVNKHMGQKRIAKRSRVKPFIKIVNYSHVMPTRYNLDIELKSIVTPDVFRDASARLNAKKQVKKLFEERYNSGKNKWFFGKLRF